MFGSNMGNGLKITQIIGGLSKTLGVAKEVIPLYKEARPMVQNAKNAFNFLKKIGNEATTRIMTNTAKNITPIKNTIKNSSKANFAIKKGPTFFQ